MAVALPAVKPTMKRTGLSGYEPCAAAAVAISAAARAASQVRSKARIIGPSLPRCRGTSARSGSLLRRLDAGVLDHFAPHRQLVFHDLEKLSRRVTDQLQAQTFQFLADVGLRHDLGRLGMDPVDDRLRQARRPHQPEPRGGLV